MAQHFVGDGRRDGRRAAVEEFGDLGHDGNVGKSARMKREILCGNMEWRFKRCPPFSAPLQNHIPACALFEGALRSPRRREQTFPSPRPKSTCALISYRSTQSRRLRGCARTAE